MNTVTYWPAGAISVDDNNEIITINYGSYIGSQSSSWFKYEYVSYTYNLVTDTML